MSNEQIESQAGPFTEAKPQGCDKPGTATPAGPDPGQVAAWAELQRLVQRAKNGDKRTLPRLRECLAKNPFLWRDAGDISLEAQAAWTKLVCGENLYQRECMVRRLNATKNELAGESSTPIEKLLVERVVTGMLQLGYLEAREAQKPEHDMRWAEYQRRRQDQAFRQHRTSLNALATLRRLVPQQTVYVPVAPQPEPTHSSADAAAAPPQMNGHVNGSRGNGHNRIAAVLDTVGTGGKA